MSDDVDLPLGEPDFCALRERAYNLRWATVQDGVIPLTAADPDLPVAPEISAALREYLAVPHLCYGPPLGLPDFRQAVAAHFAQHKGANAEAPRVIAANSAASAIALAARHLLQQGDEVVVQDPVDFLVRESALRAGATLRLWRPEAGRFTLAGLAEATTKRTRLLSLCHPHNPLGSLWSPDEVAAIAAFAGERGLRILADEVWSDVVLDGAPFLSFAAFADTPAAPWVVYGLSKGYGLAGLRIGALLAPSAEEAERLALAQGFAHTIEGAATLSQVAATAALRHAGAWRARFLRHCAAQRDMAMQRLAALPGIAMARAPQATFVLLCDVRATGLGEEDFAAMLLQRAKVQVVPGSPRWFGPGAAGHVRLSLATTRALLQEALDRTAAALTGGSTLPA